MAEKNIDTPKPSFAPTKGVHPQTRKTVDLPMDYLLSRAEEMGMTWEDNRLIPGDQYSRPILTANTYGDIDILISDIEGNAIEYDKSKSPSRHQMVDYTITRLHPDRVTKTANGTRKYLFPKGHGTFPFFPPRLQQAYRDGKKIKTLYFTEGAFKALKGSMHGLHVVGLGSITHLKKDNQMYADVLKLIDKLKPDNIIMLYDADCRDIKPDHLEESKDLRKRLYQFYSSAQIFQQMVKDCDKQIYWRCILPEIANNPKGLDDLLIVADQEGFLDKVIAEAQKVGTDGKGGYFHTLNMTITTSHVAKYLKIGDPKGFYDLHNQLIGEQEFVWHGSRYKYNTEKGELDMLVPAEAKDYKRIGPKWHKEVLIPDPFGNLNHELIEWSKVAIKEDHGGPKADEIIKHAPRYNSIVNFPSHDAYEPEINNCLNAYKPVENEIEKGDCSLSMGLMEHIFGDQLELGMDYIKLLWEKPTQVLPILCLVSEERHTGKDTFLQFMRNIFQQNMILVGNNELSSDFNSIWASKLIIACNETFLDKKKEIEMLKDKSTNNRMVMNAKNKAMQEMSFFGKFILASNNEKTFISADESEIRYWVRKIPPIPEDKRIGNFDELIREERKAFLYQIKKRKLSVAEKQSRMWFSPEQLETDALRKLKEHSKPSVAKEIKHKIREKFFNFPCDNNSKAWNTRKRPTLFLTPKMIYKELDIKRNFEAYYLTQVLTEPEHGLELQQTDKTVRYKVPTIGYRSKASNPDELEAYMKEEEDVGRPYIFPIEQFLTEEEIKNRSYDEDLGFNMPDSQDPDNDNDKGSDEDLPF